MMKELQRFPVLQKRMDEVIGNFLREGLEPSQAMIRDLIEMEMDYINTSHPNFIGGTKAVEQAMQTVKSSRIPHPVARPRVWNSLSEINICFMFLFASCEIFRTCSL
jgi:dynamin 1-like protein